MDRSLYWTIFVILVSAIAGGYVGKSLADLVVRHCGAWILVFLRAHRQAYLLKVFLHPTPKVDGSDEQKNSTKHNNG